MRPVFLAASTSVSIATPSLAKRRTGCAFLPSHLSIQLGPLPLCSSSSSVLHQSHHCWRPVLPALSQLLPRALPLVQVLASYPPGQSRDVQPPTAALWSHVVR